VEEDPPAPLVIRGTEMRALTIPEIKTIIHNFGVATVNAMKAGFDFVEFHSCHGLLPCQFFSPLENRRNDEYGGDLLRRMRFGIECIAAMRQAVGNGYSIVARIGAIDDRPGGITIEEGAEYAYQLERSGVDAISISVASRAGYIPTADQPPGCFADLAERVKQRITVPVIVAGRITTPEVAEFILARDQADLIAMGRQLIADPLWVKKVQEGRPHEITPCNGCNSCCEAFSTGKLCCPVNLGAGQETDSSS
jgi:2,4-dienoyl-CoA reductase-like NADH-dependent reductase (Old Yellow Enzyme family)